MKRGEGRDTFTAAPPSITSPRATPTECLTGAIHLHELTMNDRISHILHAAVI